MFTVINMLLLLEFFFKLLIIRLSHQELTILIFWTAWASCETFSASIREFNPNPPTAWPRQSLERSHLMLAAQAHHWRCVRYSPLTFWSTYVDVEESTLVRRQLPSASPLVVEFVWYLRSLSELCERTITMCVCCAVDCTLLGDVEWWCAQRFR